MADDLPLRADPTRLAPEIKRALEPSGWSENQAIQFLATVIANSYPGVRGHPDIDPKVMLEENIDRWVEAFRDHARRHHA